MKIKEIYPNLYHIKFKDQYTETMTFIRLQEFYESPFPNIRGQYFTLEEFMDCYAKFKGNFTYCTDWSGFNVPGNIVLEFIELFKNGMWDNNREKEMLLIHMLEKRVTNFDSGKFYVIATHKKEDLSHEIAHGLFYLKPSYRRAMERLVDFRNKYIRKLKKELLKMGYDKRFLIDEIQAYLSTDTWDKFEDKKLINKFKKVFKRYTRTNKIS